MPVVDLPPLPAEPEFCVIARWNLSLPARDRWRIFGAPAATNAPASNRLNLCFGRERWQFGDALPEETREAVARDLKRLLGARGAA